MAKGNGLDAPPRYARGFPSLFMEAGFLAAAQKVFWKVGVRPGGYVSPIASYGPICARIFAST